MFLPPLLNKFTKRAHETRVCVDKDHLCSCLCTIYVYHFMLNEWNIFINVFLLRPKINFFRFLVIGRFQNRYGDTLLYAVIGTI